jgi:hypothetical protein
MIKLCKVHMHRQAERHVRRSTEQCVHVLQEIEARMYAQTRSAARSILDRTLCHTLCVIVLQEIEARTCTDNLSGDPSSAAISRNCVAVSTADLLAKAVAKVTSEGGCVTGYKTEYCKTQASAQFATSDPQWTVFLDQVCIGLLSFETCGKQSSRLA